MRKNNPYYKGKGRPSENAIDWEFHEDLREDFHKVMGNKVEVADNGKIEYGGLLFDSKTDVYERGYCINFELNFGLTTAL